MQSHILFLFKNFDICSSWIFVLILIFCKLRENTIYLVYCFWHLLEFCPRGACGTWLTLFPAVHGSPASPGPCGPCPRALQAGRPGGVPCGFSSSGPLGVNGSTSLILSFLICYRDHSCCCNTGCWEDSVSYSQACSSEP